MAKRKERNTDERGEMLREIWGSRRRSRLSEIVDAGYCGPLTIREFIAIALADSLNFPRGLDTPMCIGDFEGNFSTNILGIMAGGRMSDHICITGDPHHHME